MARKIGFTSVTSIIVHPGYMAMLAECKKYCDYLIVGIMVNHDDRLDKGKLPNFMSAFEKYMMFRDNKHVDEIIPLYQEEDLLLCLQCLMPDIRFVGEEYECIDFTGKNFCNDNGIKLIYTNRKHTLSASKYATTIFKHKEAIEKHACRNNKS